MSPFVIIIKYQSQANFIKKRKQVYLTPGSGDSRA
jgi:hypothetical protein